MAAKQEPALILLHNLLGIKVPLLDQLQVRFRLIDSLDSTLSPQITLLLCIGPSPVTSDTIRQLPALRCIIGSSAGLDHIDLVACRRQGIAVTNAGPSFREDCADLAIGLLIDVLRRISAADGYVRRGLWPMKGDYPLGSRVSFFFPSRFECIGAKVLLKYCHWSRAD